MEDMINYQSIERPPVCGEFKAFQVCGMGPPTSGGMTTIQILKLLEDKALYKHAPTSVQSAHLFT